MATPQTAGNGNAKGAATTNPATAATGAKAPKKAKPAVELPTVKGTALSVDVGPRILSMIVDVDRASGKLTEAANAIEYKSREILAQLTMAFVKAAKADDTINLNAAFDTEDRKGINKLNEQLRIAVGISEVKQVSTGVNKLVETAAASKVWGKMSKVQRQNFAKTMKTAEQAAAGIIDLGANASFDKAAGTLLLEGPKVAKEFGLSANGAVLLNEKQKVGEGEKAFALTKKPSFTAIGNIAKVNRHIVPATRADSRPSSGVNYTSDSAFGTLCKTLVDTIAALMAKDGLSAAQLAATKSVQSAVNQALTAA